MSTASPLRAKALELIKQGLTNKQVSGKLKIKEARVRNWKYQDSLKARKTHTNEQGKGKIETIEDEAPLGNLTKLAEMNEKLSVIGFNSLEIEIMIVSLLKFYDFQKKNKHDSDLPIIKFLINKLLG